GPTPTPRRRPSRTTRIACWKAPGPPRARAAASNALRPSPTRRPPTTVCRAGVASTGPRPNSITVPDQLTRKGASRPLFGYAAPPWTTDGLRLRGGRRGGSCPRRRRARLLRLELGPRSRTGARDAPGHEHSTG